MGLNTLGEARPRRAPSLAGGHADPEVAPGRLPALYATRLRAALLVSAVAALLVVPPIGARTIATGGINGDDEARFVMLARDVLARHVWFDLHERDVLSNEKPPLYPWLIAAFSLPRGRVSEASARAPVAVATVFTVLMTFLLGERLFGRRAGVWAALVLATSLDVFWNSQLILPDMLVVGFATAAGLAFWRAAREDSPAALAAFYALLAFAVFAKGPLGLLPLLTAGVWLWTEHGAREIPRRLWSPFGIAAFAAVTLAWLVPFLTLGPRQFASHVLWDDWLSWFLIGPRAPGELFDTVAIGFLPWTIVAPLALWQAVRERRTPAVRFALLWLVVPLGVLMQAANYKMRYSLSIYPGAALIVAWWADARGARSTAAGRLVGALAIPMVVAGSVALHRPRWWDAQTRLYLTGVTWQLLPAVAGMLAIGALVLVGLWRGRPALLVQGVAAVTAAVLAYGVWPYTARYNDVWGFEALAAAVDRYGGGSEPGVFLHNYDWYSMDVYFRRPPRRIGGVDELGRYLERAERPVVVVEERSLQGIRVQLPPDVQVLERVRIGRDTMSVVRLGPTAFR